MYNVAKDEQNTAMPEMKVTSGGWSVHLDACYAKKHFSHYRIPYVIHTSSDVCLLSVYSVVSFLRPWYFKQKNIHYVWYDVKSKMHVH